MFDYDDIEAQFYAIDDIYWAQSLETIMNTLNFSVTLEYVCDWEAFAYARSGKVKYLNKEDKKTLAECSEIASFKTKGRFHKFANIAVKIHGNRKLRNERACDIYRLFRKIYGMFLFFTVYYDQEIAFLGTTLDGKNRGRVIISDWFSYKNENGKLGDIGQIDSGLFSTMSIKSAYQDYLWAISRPYTKYPESKMYLIFGVGNEETYEGLTSRQDGDGLSIKIRVDREETLRKNEDYYFYQYENDYYLDDGENLDGIGAIIDEDQIEFEWTMLEMQLADEQIEDESDDYFEEEFIDYNAYDRRYLSGMNPEQMLKYIQNETNKLS